MEITVHPNSILGKSRSDLAYWQQELPRLRALLQQRQAELSRISGLQPNISMSAQDIANLTSLKIAAQVAVDMVRAAVGNAEFNFSNQLSGTASQETQVRNLVADIEHRKKQGVSFAYENQLLGGLIGEKQP